MAYTYRCKIKRCGNHIRIVGYDELIVRGYEQNLSHATAKQSDYFYSYVDGEFYYVDKETGEIKTKEDKRLESRRRTTARAKNDLMDIINANFTTKDKFLTLTYAEDMQDITKAKSHINEFFKRVREKHPNFKYAYVIEFHKSGKIHFHAIMNTPYLRKKLIESMWKRGFVKINQIKHVRNVGAYLVKYMTKGGVDERLIGKKLYQTSYNCEKPQWQYFDELPEDVAALVSDKKKISYASSYQTDRNGTAYLTEITL